MTTPAARLRQSRRTAAWAALWLGCVLVGLCFVFGRVVQLQLSMTHGPLPVATRVDLGRRGDVVDRRGRVIATSTLAWRLFVDPQELADPGTIAVDLAGHLGADPAEIDRRILEATSRRYVVIASGLDAERTEAIRRAGLHGVGLEPHLVRHHPHGTLAAGVLGTVGREHSGLSGAEHAFQEPLAHSNGSLQYVHDAGRRPIWFAPEASEPAVDGDDLRLTIDLVIQRLAETRLAEAVGAHRAAGGRLVVLDVTTGGIMAIADYLNPEAREGTAIGDPGRSADPALGRNRCATDPYEPGSTFKPFVWAMATELGLAKPDEILPTPADHYHLTSQGRRIRDTHLVGDATWRTCLMRSLNSGMAIVAERMSDAEMQDVIDRFGFGIPTRCGIPGESAGMVTPRAKWSHYTQTSVSMGHEIAVTTLQLVRAFSAFARDGTVPALTIVEPGPDATALPFVQRACSRETAILVRQVLRDVVTEGTGRPARSDRYQLFGKSGTPQLTRPEGGGYHEDRYIASFIAGAPYENPRIVVLAVIDDPDKSIAHYGGPVAGPVVKDVIEGALEYLGVPTE